MHRLKPQLLGPSLISFYCWSSPCHLALLAPASTALSPALLQLPFLREASASGCTKYAVLSGPPSHPEVVVRTDPTSIDLETDPDCVTEAGPQLPTLLRLFGPGIATLCPLGPWASLSFPKAAAPSFTYRSTQLL